jgi:MFS family permease
VIQSDTPGLSAAPNHPLAMRMGVIAFLSHNIIIGTIFGTTAALLKPMQERLHITPDMASLGTLSVMVGSALLAFVAGSLAGKYSLRNLLAGSAALATAAWLILAFNNSYGLFLAAYGLLLGPAMSLAGSVLPPTLVTRWFTSNRGLALGLVHLPIVVAILPVAITWTVGQYGLQTAFLVLAAGCGLVLLPATLMVIDHPPGETARDASAVANEAGASGTVLSVGQLFLQPRFWGFALAVGAINTSSVVLGTHLMSMAESWGIARTDAAILQTVMSLVGIVGSILFGFVADRLGGGRTLALILFDACLLWLLFLLNLPFAGLLVVVGLIGMHGAGAIPSIGRALADVFGQENFSRAFGLAATASLPLMALFVVGTGAVVRINHSYTVAILAMVGFLMLAIPLALIASRRAGK